MNYVLVFPHSVGKITRHENCGATRERSANSRRRRQYLLYVATGPGSLYSGPRSCRDEVRCLVEGSRRMR
jgi:predicted metalloprotease